MSEDNLNYNCIAAQSSNSSQAQAKPCWTRLNQAWTYSAQHALRFKPWLIGPKASKNPFPAVTGTGLGKDRDREREKSASERQREISFSLHPFTWAPIGSIQFCILPFSDLLSIQYAQPFLLAQLVGKPRCCICLVALSELKVMSRDYQQPGNLEN